MKKLALGIAFALSLAVTGARAQTATPADPDDAANKAKIAADQADITKDKAAIKADVAADKAAAAKLKADRAKLEADKKAGNKDAIAAD